MADKPNPTISVAEAAEMLGVSTKTAYTLIHRQDFPVLWIGRRARVNREGLLRWIDKNTQNMEVTA